MTPNWLISAPLRAASPPTDGESRMRHSFAQISDPHLTSLEQVPFRQLMGKRLLGYISWRRRRRAEHQMRVLQALQQDLDSIELIQLLITGDLTHIGLPQEFLQASAWLKRPSSPVVQ